MTRKEVLDRFIAIRGGKRIPDVYGGGSDFDRDLMRDVTEALDADGSELAAVWMLVMEVVFRRVALGKWYHRDTATSGIHCNSDVLGMVELVLENAPRGIA